MPVTRHAEAVAVLADPRYTPPPVPAGQTEGTLAWLRSRVSRFCAGQEHAERRRPLVDLLDALDPAELRAAARALTLEREGRRRGVPAAVLGAALGVHDTRAVPAAAAGYLSGEESPQADAAVADLLEQTGVPVITLLLQAHAATEGLIENALAHDRGGDVETLLHETLRHDPPLQATRRLDTRTGEKLTIDLVAVNRDPDVFPDPERFDSARGRTPHLTFGSGVRPCPAPDHALALAAGVLEALR
ncbi:hypothetical protein SAMN05421874_12621 [Nonomuraea maritima]|uniref:Cytochrome P450 n=1 Tax=Nonomuraea maritima TaxID=683260 RepID=A0A1G9LU68_9ACTN|nr:hypothetical protein [Nonomuraea maritima]SDL65354.1 hypothetical protein SAMN05421874_12621 [Nonomuraea maritima]